MTYKGGKARLCTLAEPALHPTHTRAHTHTHTHALSHTHPKHGQQQQSKTRSSGGGSSTMEDRAAPHRGTGLLRLLWVLPPGIATAAAVAAAAARPSRTRPETHADQTGYMLLLGWTGFELKGGGSIQPLG